MNGKVSTYAEFSNPETAKQAVRALRAAGFEDISTEDLANPMCAKVDVGDPPLKKSIRYSLTGVLIGAIFGCALGFLVFVLPAMVFNIHFTLAVSIIGVILCIGVGAVIGLEQAYVLSGRWQNAGTSVIDGRPVGVCVCTHEGGPRLIRAREIFSMYCEDTSQRERRWWQMRRWVTGLGT